MQLDSNLISQYLRDYKASTKRRRVASLRVFIIIVLCTLVSAWIAQVDIGVLINRSGGIVSYFDRILILDSGSSAGQRVWQDPIDWYWGLGKWLSLLADTLLMAYIGTVMGVVGALSLCFLACSNLTHNTAIRIVTKRFLEFCRTIPDIVFALIFVVAFGLGAFPGVLAIAIHTMGALGKQFSEVAENIDMKPVEGVNATGANWIAMVRFAVIPQVFSNFASYSLLRFEINVRNASVLGFVGAGGIGQDLIEAIRKFYYSDVSAILLLIILTVVLIDILTEKFRHKFLGWENS